jgi:predicted phosphoribosyltransferase
VIGVNMGKAEKNVKGFRTEPEDTDEDLVNESDKMMFLSTPSFFSKIGQLYTEFDHLEDDEVIRLLKN